MGGGRAKNSPLEPAYVLSVEAHGIMAPLSLFRTGARQMVQLPLARR